MTSSSERVREGKFWCYTSFYRLTNYDRLIALMLVKLGLDVDDCIRLYKILSEEIFSHRHLLGVLTLGFGRAKYCGKHLRKVLVEKVIKPSPPMQHRDPEKLYLEEVNSHESFRWQVFQIKSAGGYLLIAFSAVVCRELNLDNMDRKRECVFLCSRRATDDTSAALYHKCRMQQRNSSEGHIKVADAARATSAAPTYFSPVKLLEKYYLVDGGFGETNNPSKAAWNHYFNMRVGDYEQVNVINIGTGSEPKDYQRKKDWSDILLPSVIQRAFHTVRDLEKLTTDSDAVGLDMELIQMCAKTLNFSRFSANTGELHNIGLHEYKRQAEIISLTEEYLRTSKARDDLHIVAVRLANSYRARNPEMLRTGNDTVPETIHQADDDLSNVLRRTSPASLRGRMIEDDNASDQSSVSTRSHHTASGSHDIAEPRMQTSTIHDTSLLSAPDNTPRTSMNTSRPSSVSDIVPAVHKKSIALISAHIGDIDNVGKAST